MDSTPIAALFEHQPVTDPSIRKYELSRYSAQQQLGTSGVNVAEITIDARSAGMDSLVLLQRAWIGVKCHVYAANKTTEIAGPKNQLIENGWSLFQRAGLYISDAEVEQVDRPGIVSHFKRLVEWSADAVYGQGPAASYYPIATSITTSPALADDAGVIADSNLYKGVIRYQCTDLNADGKAVQYLKLPLRDIFGFCNVDKALMGANIKLRLQPESSFERVVLRGVNSTAASVHIDEVDLYLPVARPDNATLANIYGQIKSGKTIPYEFERWNYFPYDIANGSTAENVVLPNFSKRPTSVIVGMQLATAESEFTVDKLQTKLFGLTSHRLMMDSKVYPEISFEGSAKGYLHEYETFLQLGNKHRTDAFGTFVDFDKWKNAYPLIAYDISAVRDEFGSVRSNPPVIRWTAAHSNPGATAKAHFIIVGKEVKELNVVNDIMVVSAPEFKD